MKQADKLQYSRPSMILNTQIKHTIQFLHITVRISTISWDKIRRQNFTYCFLMRKPMPAFKTYVFCKESRIWVRKKLIPTKQLSILFAVNFLIKWVRLNYATTHHQPKYIHHSPPPTTSQNGSTTTHHHPPPAKIYQPPPKTSQDISTNTHHHPPTAKTFF